MKENEFKTWLDDSVQPGAVVMKDGVHFGYYAAGTGQPELLLYEKGRGRNTSGEGGLLGTN